MCYPYTDDLVVRRSSKRAVRPLSVAAGHPPHHRTSESAVIISRSPSSPQHDRTSESAVIITRAPSIPQHSQTSESAVIITRTPPRRYSYRLPVKQHHLMQNDMTEKAQRQEKIRPIHPHTCDLNPKSRRSTRGDSTVQEIGKAPTRSKLQSRSRDQGSSSPSSSSSSIPIRAYRELKKEFSSLREAVKKFEKKHEQCRCDRELDQRIWESGSHRSFRPGRWRGPSSGPYLHGRRE